MIGELDFKNIRSFCHLPGVMAACYSLVPEGLAFCIWVTMYFLSQNTLAKFLQSRLCLPQGRGALLRVAELRTWPLCLGRSGLPISFCKCHGIWSGLLLQGKQHCWCWDVQGALCGAGEPEATFHVADLRPREGHGVGLPCLFPGQAASALPGGGGEGCSALDCLPVPGRALCQASSVVVGVVEPCFSSAWGQG